MNGITWEAHEYKQRNNSSDWYWAVGIISVAIAALSIFLGNILFGILIILAAFTLALFAARVPAIITCEVNERGVRIDRDFYPYDSLASFWVDEASHDPKVLIKSKRLLMPLLILPLGAADHNDVRDFLVHVLPEEFLAEPVTQKIAEYLGF